MRSEKLKPNEYQCSRCKGIFEKGWTDEEAIAEMKRNHGDNITTDDCGVLCDDCYNEFIKWRNSPNFPNFDNK